MRKPTPRVEVEPSRQEWIAFAVAQGMSEDDAQTVSDDALRRWFEEDDDE